MTFAKLFDILCQYTKLTNAGVAQSGRRVRQQHSMLLLAKAHKGYARSAEEPWALPTLLSKTEYAGVAQSVEQVIRNH